MAKKTTVKKDKKIAPAKSVVAEAKTETVDKPEKSSTVLIRSTGW